MIKIAQGLWMGSDLSLVEQLCIKSFQHHGFEFHLYVYDKNLKNIPEGTIILDANEIVDESKVFKYENGSLAGFSNIFRITLLYKKGGLWVDMDCVCVNDFDIQTKYLIATEYKTKESIRLWFGMVYVDKAQDWKIERTMKESLRLRKRAMAGKIKWGIGQRLAEYMQKIIPDSDKYIYEPKHFVSCACEEFRSILDQNSKNTCGFNKMSDIPNDMMVIHLYNEFWRRNKINKNKPEQRDGSIFDDFIKKYI
jgi:hypothetical protein